VLKKRKRSASLARGFFVGLLLLCNASPAQQSSGGSAIDQLEKLNRSVQGIVTRVAPAIVRIDVVGYSRSDENDAKEKSETHLVTKKESLASGIILDSDGYIVTNAHVLAGARRVRVNLDQRVDPAGPSTSKTSSSTYDARIVGIFSQADVALLKIEATGLPVLSVADSSKIQQGQLVFAVGNPEGLNNSISMGMVSAVARPREAEASPLYIQTDAAINPGSSGGALVDIHGQLVGMTSFILTEGGGSEGLGFALPSSMVYLIYKELRRNGHVEVGDVGLKVQSINTTMASGLRLPRDSGLIVSDVVADSPAEAAGVRVQDILVSIDETPIDTAAQYATVFYTKRQGNRVELKLLRGSDYVQTSMPVQQVVDDPEDPLEQPDLNKGIVKTLGIVGTTFNDKTHTTDEALRSRSGILVSGRLAHTDLETGIAVGDLIRSVNGNDVKTVEDLRSRVEAFKTGDAVVLQVERHGRLRYLPFEMD
jgi:serine protease Do